MNVTFLVILIKICMNCLSFWWYFFGGIKLKDLLQTPYEEMVIACLKDSEKADYDAIVSQYVHCNERKLFEFANQHEVATIIAMRLRHLGKSSPLWNGPTDDWKYRLTQRFEKLDALVSCLEASNIRVMALKNAAIARAIYPVWEECPMGNFDLLVLPEDLERTGVIFADNGMTHVEHTKKSFSQEYHAELSDDELWIKLQTRPFTDPTGTTDMSAFVRRMFDRSLSVDGTPLRIPSPEDHLLLICMSILRRRYVCVPGIRMYTEIDRVIRRSPFFTWNKFIEQARFVGTAIYFALYIPKMLLDTPIPENVFDAFRPTKTAFTRFMRVIRQTGLFYPPKNLSFFRECQMLSALYATPKDICRAIYYRER